MELTIQIPDELARDLTADASDLSRRALEGFALEEYKSGRLTKRALRQLLGFATGDQLDGFLKAHDVWIDYTIEDLQREREGLRRLGY